MGVDRVESNADDKLQASKAAINFIPLLLRY